MQEVEDVLVRLLCECASCLYAVVHDRLDYVLRLVELVARQARLCSTHNSRYVVADELDQRHAL